VNDADVRRVPNDEADGDEGWQRLTDEPDVRGVESIRQGDLDPWSWSVTVWAMEFVREEPLESDLRRTIGEAIGSVPGVAEVAEDDREVWAVSGSPAGDALTRAVAQAVDALADRTRSHIAHLGE
jgi:hypothetical protein